MTTLVEIPGIWIMTDDFNPQKFPGLRFKPGPTPNIHVGYWEMIYEDEGQYPPGCLGPHFGRRIE